ncbi:MAG: glycosyl transferase family 9 [Rhodospirillales bacterium]|nr:glycosyl transferase family 9 [Rhodospirillales bacterium]
MRDLAGARREADLGLGLSVAGADIVARNALGSVLYELGDLDAARGLFQDVLAENPRYGDALNNLGNILAHEGKPRAALEFYERALAASPDNADYLANLGGVRQALGDLAGALECFARALVIDPAHADARWNRGLARLLSGDLAGGFADYETRWSLPEFTARKLEASVWSGEDVRGQTILIHSEQGYGDTIQMVRFAKVLAGRGARVLVETHATLAPLLRNVTGIAEVVVHGDALPPFDLHIAMMSLPHACGVSSFSDLPSEYPYIRPLFDTRNELPPRDGDELRVGLVWAGRPTHKNDRNRSLDAGRLAPLATVAKVKLFSLQIGATSADLAQLPGIVDLAPQLSDFAATANVLEQLDLVVTVDTAVAHLAGAMGKDAWVMLPFAPDWRWLLGRDTSPWYPSLRLYRQPKIGDWKSVVAKIATDLAAR